MTRTWKDVSKAKCAEREARIPVEWRLKTPPKGTNVMDVPRTCRVLSDRELQITETPAVKLVAKMVDKTYTAEEVTTAFSKRAAVAHQLTNCLSEIFFDEGIKAAKALDEEYSRTGEPKGAMHGLPISLKDSINIPGYDTTIGFISHCNMPAEEEALLAKIMREAGAIFYCKTNVPTGMLMGDTYNNVWGYTTNPYNTDYGAGGSSGGESALLALRGSPLGVGSDIGGSIRMPAAITGIYGIKAAAGRYPTLGCKSGLLGQESVKGVQGPMSTDLESLELWSKVILDAAPWEQDPSTYPVPWKSDYKLPDKLCFGRMRWLFTLLTSGILMDDGVVRPTPPVKRALLETKAALEAAGHKVIEWTPPEIPTGQSILWRCFLADGGRVIHKQLREGSTPEPYPQDLHMFEESYQKTKDHPSTVEELWELNAERNVFNRTLLDSWAKTREATGTGRPLDGLISPVVAFPAAPAYKFRHLGYTGLWNIADHVGVGLPVTYATKDDIVKEQFEYRNDDEKLIYETFDADKLDGMPVGLQIVVPRHQEERGLKLTAVAADALKNAKK